jgi:tetratricopeptide (TPR) repeat protein
LQHDPLSAAANNSLAQVLHAAGRFDEAETAYRRALELAPKRAVTRGYLSLTLLAQGRGADALAEATQEPNELFRLWALAIVHHVTGDTAASDGALAELIAKYSDLAAFQIAEVCAARTDANHAFEWLQRAFADGDPGLSEIKCGPLFRPLHGDTRWIEWVRTMALED